MSNCFHDVDRRNCPKLHKCHQKQTFLLLSQHHTLNPNKLLLFLLTWASIIPKHNQIFPSQSAFSVSSDIPRLDSAAFMFASRTLERWVGLTEGQRSLFEESLHLRLSSSAVIVALKALLLFRGYHDLLNKGRAKDTSFTSCMHGNLHFFYY